MTTAISDTEAMSLAARFMGQKGGASRSQAKVDAARRNAKLGGRPRIYSGRCTRYPYHRFLKDARDPDRCACGYHKRSKPQR